MPPPQPGELHRVLDSGLLALLQSPIGLQLIDISDPRKPSLVGSYRQIGDPFELHVHGERAVVLFNEVTRLDVKADGRLAEARSTGLLAVIDISKPSKPALIDSTLIEGNIHWSRLRIADRTAVLSLGWRAQELDDRSPIQVASFEVSGQRIERLSDVEATDETPAPAREYNVSRLEGAVSAVSASGVIETGLMLTQNDSDGAVHLSTFSESTVTPRGRILCLGNQRFFAAASAFGSITYASIALFDKANLDRPTALGHLDHAPFINGVLSYGNHAAAVRFSGFSTCGDETSERPYSGASIDLLSGDGELDGSNALERIGMPLHTVVKAGTLLAAVDFASGYGDSRTRIELLDLRDPTHPKRLGSAVSDEVGRPICRDDEAHHRDTKLEIPCADSMSGTARGGVFALRNALVLTFSSVSEEVAQSDAGERDPAAPIAKHYKLKALDIREPAHPRFGPLVEMPAADGLMSVIADDSSIYYTFADSTVVYGTGEPHLRYAFRQIDFSRPDAPMVGPAINIPGELIAIRGNTLFTLERLVSDESEQHYVHRLELEGGEAVLRATHSFEGREVKDVIVTDRRVFALHSPLHSSPDALDTLSLDDLSPLSTSELEPCAHLLGLDEDRAICRWGEFVTVFDVRDPAAPRMTASLAVGYESEQIVLEDQRLLVAAGHGGVLQLDLRLPAASK